MAEIALSGAAETSATAMSRLRILHGLRLGDAVFLHLTRAAALLVLLILSGIIIGLIIGAIPAFKTFGLGFLTGTDWDPNPAAETYGALPAIYGTVVTSFIAMLVAVPLGLLIALFLTELCPTWLRRPVGIAIELLAGVPSIIYGIWGFFFLGPFLQNRLEPLLVDLFHNVPVLSALFNGDDGLGLASMFNASLILAIMVLPFVTSISRDVFAVVPAVLKEAAYGVGCTTWEVIWHVVLPFARVGVIGGVMLALGRALGETMAVTFIIGNAHNIKPSLLAPGTSISAAIAAEFLEAISDLHKSSLIALGLILFVITFIVLAAARLLLLRIEKRVG
jgi:phosphate transport system permease protein